MNKDVESLLSNLSESGADAAILAAILELSQNKVPQVDRKEQEAFSHRENIALLRSLHYPHETRMLKCSWCGGVFQTNYCGDSTCSPLCTKSDIKARMGIVPEPRIKPKMESFEPAMLISADKLGAVYEWAKEFIRGYEYVNEIHDQPAINRSARPQSQIVEIKDGRTKVRFAEQSLNPFPLPDYKLNQSQKIDQSSLDDEVLDLVPDSPVEVSFSPHSLFGDPQEEVSPLVENKTEVDLLSEPEELSVDLDLGDIFGAL